MPSDADGGPCRDPDDLAEHALLILAGNETGELEFTALGELPNELAVPVRTRFPFGSSCSISDSAA